MKVNKIDLNFNDDKGKPNPKAPTSIDKNNQFKKKDNKKDLHFNYDKDKPKVPTSIDKKNQIKDKKGLVIQSKEKESKSKKTKRAEERYNFDLDLNLDNNKNIKTQKKIISNTKSEIDKKGKNINSRQGPKFDPNRFMDKGKKKFNINNSTKEQNRKEDKNKDLQNQEENQDKAIFINSINEIRLPELLYDISYDLLQNQ